MTRLFIRFYLGVILILFIAWVIQAYVFRGTTETENIAVIEHALSGGALSARDDIVEGGNDNFERTMAEVRSRFAYPVNIVKRSERRMTSAMSARVDLGEAVLNGNKIDVALPETELLVELGPLPRFAGPTHSDVLLGLGSVFLLVAGAIAVLLRPIARQFRIVEKTAIAITDGDFSARINEGKRKRALPIVGAFNKMAERVESLLRSQKELLQAVSHELRTPLARIKFATELVRTADSETKRQQRLESIDEATDRLDDLVGELLDYSRLDEGSETAAYETVQVNDLAADAISLYAPLYPEIRFQLTDSPEVDMTTYRAGLSRAIGNLVSNAGKYASSKVILSVSRESDLMTVAVDDDGPGIAKADREEVFKPFTRLTKHDEPGSGLGLALVRRICRRLNGEVSVTESELGGAKFVIRLPK
ncbi:sensor histidine kinase [Rubripirellula reticaptiva]|uniref:histidine kinase n=1 Tax=Rubripirellula reticaptiva TaxID=2528013 RepID=A0A5C6ED72_9BACT|nr:ATP-binding protein [Rubripirellula reticaptiva]TWU46972.1 Sensor protein RstB [Rubripirellula reticaptiva]